MFQPAQLEALVAVVHAGTFEAAARSLGVTPSAVSQRIRALETQVGQVVVTRAAPCLPTEAGEVLVALGRQTALLAAEAHAQLGGAGAEDGEERAGVRRLALAVNADSLATWFRAVFATVAQWPDVALEIFVEDQAHSARLLREGRVLGAVTSQAQAVQACSVQPLTRLRYHPVVARELLERAGGERSPRWEDVPMVRFNEIDDLQHQWLREHGHAASRVVHRVPTTADFADAVRAGLGWGMYLDGQLARARRRGDDVVELAPGRPLVVPLYWQRWRVRSRLLEQVSEEIARAAGA